MKKIVKIIIAVVLIFYGYMYIQARNFNGFGLARYYEGRTQVSRDSNEQYNKEWSYKIDSVDYNDFMIYKTIQVKKNTAYKVSCMVKTKNIEPETINNSGFNICLKDSLEKSTSIMGTNDWMKLDFYFDSLNNESIDIAFRLGDNEGNCKGTAWFSNISIEEGRKKQTNEWDMAVFMINNTNAKSNNKTVSTKLTSEQIGEIDTDLKRFQTTINDFSNGKINVKYDVISIQEPLKHISYDDESGHFVSPQDVYTLIDKYLHQNKDYDHIFVVINIGDIIENKEIPWIGLGSMVYDSIGYSNIRISNNIINSYKYSSQNYFPEEVFLHEFLHTLERNSNRLGNKTIVLHENEKYGYKNEARYGLRQWYIDYMQKNIKGNLGLEEDVFYTQPVSAKNFIQIDTATNKLYDTQNIVQKIVENISKIV